MKGKNSNSIAISIIETKVSDSSFPQDGRSMFPSFRQTVLKTAHIATATLSDNLSDFVETLRNLVDAIPPSRGNYEIDQVSFSLNVDGSGKISLVGELSAGFTSGITVTLKKIKREET